MRCAARVLAPVMAMTVLAGCSLLNPPLLPGRPVETGRFAPVLDEYAGSVGRVLAPRCSGAPVAGSGFAVDGHLLLTAAHVVDGARQVSVRLGDRPPLLADVVGVDADADTALLRLPDVVSVRPLTLAVADSTSPGTEVAALGYPLGESGLHTEFTRITATTETAIVNDRSMRQLLTVDATLRAGTSGGPAIDVDGRVRGMVVAAFAGRGGRDSVATIALAIPTGSLLADLDRWRGAAAVAPARCDGEFAADAPAPALASDGGDAELAHTLWLLGAGIARGQFGSTWGMLTVEQQARVGSPATWHGRHAMDRWLRIEVLTASRDGDRATARARLRSAGDGSCFDSTHDYRFRRVEGVWLVDADTLVTSAEVEGSCH